MLQWKNVAEDVEANSYISKEEIEETTIPKRSPCSEGFDERLVGCVKKTIKSVGRRRGMDRHLCLLFHV